MKKMIGCIVGMLVLASTMADAGIFTNVTVSAEVPYLTSFTSRGRIFQDNGVIQPNVTVNKQMGDKAIFVNLWQNESFDRKHGNIWNETDLTIGGTATDPWSELTFNYGLINYIYSDMQINLDVPVEDTKEVYFGISSTFMGVNPSATVYYDIEQVNGGYVVFGLNHGFAVTKNSKLVADTNIGFGSNTYNDFYFGVKQSRVNDWNSGLTYSYSVSDKLTLNAGLRYSYLVDSEISENAKSIYDGNNIMIGKVGLNYNF